MNIKEAKEEIARTLRAYTRKSVSGEYCIPLDKQRPVLLMGPPGIGKTAIMQQIAREEQVGLVAYAMTHHTRQSAIGLPFIVKKKYGEREYSITEYTMSEIVASVYNTMEQTGQKTGILFIDEINCVSETLAPVMLQLLQNKTFGTHQIPEGWIVVAAGNPPEYNRAVRPLDMATLDRVKHMEIEADLSIWLEYARCHGVHPAIRGYLGVYPQYFYRIDRESQQQLFVTARGWEDLSCILKAYEEEEDKIEESLILQYLQHDEAAHSFYLFYDLFMHFQKQGAGIKALEHGDASQILSAAAFLSEEITHLAEDWIHQWHLEEARLQICRQWQKEFESMDSYEQAMNRMQEALAKRVEAEKIKKEHQLISLEEQLEEEQLQTSLEQLIHSIQKQGNASLACIRQYMNAMETRKKEQQKKTAIDLDHRISEAYKCLEQTPINAGLLYFTSDLTNQDECCKFLTMHPNSAYEKYCGDIIL